MFFGLVHRTLVLVASSHQGIGSNPSHETLCPRTRHLKECYRIGKKQKSLRSQIYIKFTQSNDDDVENIPGNISVWNVIIWWEIINLIPRLEFIAQWVFHSFLFWHRCNAKFLTVFFFHYFLVTQRADRSQTSTGLSVKWLDYIQCLHCQKLFS